MILFTKDLNQNYKYPFLNINEFKSQSYLLFKMSGKEATSAPEKKKKESILDLTRLVENK